MLAEYGINNINQSIDVAVRLSIGELMGFGGNYPVSIAEKISTSVANKFMKAKYKDIRAILVSEEGVNELVRMIREKVVDDIVKKYNLEPNKK